MLGYDVMMKARVQLVITTAVLGLATVANAQDQQPDRNKEAARAHPENRVDGLVAMLEDPVWIRRERAMQLLGDPNEGFELDMLAPIFERPDLSAEARVRLLASARGLFGASTKAGLGVGFGSVREGGVEITSVVPEVDRFPAAAMLKPGDLIVGAEGKQLTTSTDLRAVILSYEPGDFLNLQVERDDRVLDLDLPLGAYNALRGAAPISNNVADRAIELRWARKGIVLHPTDPIGGEISIDSWIEAGYPEGSGKANVAGSRRMERVSRPGSARDVYVGVGVMHRGRIEPWADKTNAMNAMGQARRIELDRSMKVVRMRIKVLKRGMEMLENFRAVDPNESRAGNDMKARLERAQGELRDAQQDLEAYQVELDSLGPDASP